LIQTHLPKITEDLFISNQFPFRDNQIQFFHYPIIPFLFVLDRKIADELDLFKSSTNPLQFYDSTSQSMKTVYLDLLCSLQDQPERRTSVGLMLGNSTYACRFGYLCDYRKLHKVVKSCNQCFQSMLDNGNATPDCRNCVNWDLPEDCDILKFQPNHNYPSDSPYLTYDKMIFPQKLTVSYLK
jgi:hypothetical protein